MKYIFLFAIFVATSVLKIQAQDKQQKDKPLELPEFVINGTERANVPGGTKMFPLSSLLLSQKQLDGLNSLEKQQSPLLPPAPLPVISPKPQLYNGFLRGELGFYVSPTVDAGYQTKLSGYDIYARGGFSTSNGHQTDADYSKIYLNLNAGYLAPAEFVFFGGSRTDSYIHYEGKSYKLYAIPNAPERTARNFALGANVNGNFEGLAYAGGIGLANTSFSQSGDVSNNLLHGFAEANQLWHGYKIGGRLAMDFSTLRGNGYHFIELAGTGEYTADKMVLAGNLGVQIAQNSLGESQGGALFKLRLDYLLSENFTIRGILHSGLEKNSFAEMFRENPYLADSAQVQFSRTKIEFGGQILYHPNTIFSASGGIFLRSSGDFQMFSPTTSATFQTIYKDISALEIKGEASYVLSQKNSISALLEIRSATTSDSSKSVPYIIPIHFQVDWQHFWTNEWRTNVQIAYISERNANIQNTVNLPSFFDVNIGGDYALNNRLAIFARLNNLLGADIQLWQGYKERGIFGAAGVTWQF